MAAILEQLTKVEAVMLDFLTNHTDNTRLLESMQYSISAGGKRLRPQLLLATVAAFNCPITKSQLEVAASLEMVHTYSLIHDDLPAMDDDALRRGKPTNHVAFDEATAILAGDGLLTAAFQLLSQIELSAAIKVALLAELAKASGTQGMVAGQASDIEGENAQLTLAELKAIHANKTGALLTYPLVAGAILAEADQAAVETLRQVGQHLGLAFQIRDDLLDVISTTEELGKVVGRDEALHKSTYPALLGLEGAKTALDDELQGAMRLLSQLHQSLLTFDERLLVEICEKLKI